MVNVFMAIVTFIRPIKEIRGMLKKGDTYYVRQLYGQWIVQRCPRKTSEKQRAMRQAFGERYGGRRIEKEVRTKSARSPVVLREVIVESQKSH